MSEEVDSLAEILLNCCSNSQEVSAAANQTVSKMIHSAETYDLFLQILENEKYDYKAQICAASALKALLRANFVRRNSIENCLFDLAHRTQELLLTNHPVYDFMIDYYNIYRTTEVKHDDFFENYFQRVLEIIGEDLPEDHTIKILKLLLILFPRHFRRNLFQDQNPEREAIGVCAIMKFFDVDLISTESGRKMIELCYSMISEIKNLLFMTDVEKHLLNLIEEVLDVSFETQVNSFDPGITTFYDSLITFLVNNCTLITLRANPENPEINEIAQKTYDLIFRMALQLAAVHYPPHLINKCIYSIKFSVEVSIDQINFFYDLCYLDEAAIADIEDNPFMYIFTAFPSKTSKALRTSMKEVLYRSAMLHKHIMTHILSNEANEATFYMAGFLASTALITIDGCEAVLVNLVERGIEGASQYDQGTLASFLYLLNKALVGDVLEDHLDKIAAIAVECFESDSVVVVEMALRLITRLLKNEKYEDKAELAERCFERVVEIGPEWQTRSVSKFFTCFISLGTDIGEYVLPIFQMMLQSMYGMMCQEPGEYDEDSNKDTIQSINEQLCSLIEHFGDALICDELTEYIDVMIKAPTNTFAEHFAMMVQSFNVFQPETLCEIYVAIVNGFETNKALMGAMNKFIDAFFNLAEKYPTAISEFGLSEPLANIVLKAISSTNTALEVDGAMYATFLLNVDESVDVTEILNATEYVSNSSAKVLLMAAFSAFRGVQFSASDVTGEWAESVMNSYLLSQCELETHFIGLCLTAIRDPDLAEFVKEPVNRCYFSLKSFKERKQRLPVMSYDLDELYTQFCEIES